MSRPLPLNPTFLPPTYGVLKSLLENPLKLPLAHEDGEASRAAAAPRSPRRPSAPLSARPEMAARRRRRPRAVRYRDGFGAAPGAAAQTQRSSAAAEGCEPRFGCELRSTAEAESREEPEVPQSRGHGAAGGVLSGSPKRLREMGCFPTTLRCRDE